MKVMIGFSLLAASMSWSVSAAASDAPVRANTVQTHSSYAQPRYNGSAYKGQAVNSNTAYATSTAAGQLAKTSGQKTVDLTKKSTCNGPTKGSVTYPGSKKRYDLMGRRIK